MVVAFIKGDLYMRKIKTVFLILAQIILLQDCSTYVPKLTDSGFSDSRELSESQLLKPTSKKLVELISFHTGEIEVDTSILLSLKKEKKLKNKKFYVPVLSHLVRHSEKGDILIDTGMDESFSKSGHGNFGCLAKLVSFARQKPGMDIGAQLKSKNANLSAVYFTHAHLDHTSGVPALPKNIPYYAGKGTIDDSFADIFGVCSNHLDGIDSIKEIDFNKAAIVKELGKVLDIFGDGTLWAIHTPGHSAGHMSFLVNTKDGSYLITGDASHTGYGFKNKIPPGKNVNLEQTEETLNKLIQFVNRHPEIKLIFGHDIQNTFQPEVD